MLLKSLLRTHLMLSGEAGEDSRGDGGPGGGDGEAQGGHQQQGGAS